MIIIKRHVLKPETTQRNGRNETTEMAKMKPPKRAKRAKINEQVKKDDLYLAPTIDPHV